MQVNREGSSDSLSGESGEIHDSNHSFMREAGWILKANPKTRPISVRQEEMKSFGEKTVDDIPEIYTVK